jgi:hypothetical protein
MSINIKKYKENFDKFEENSVIQNLFRIEKIRVDEIIAFGFRFNYEHRHFEAEIIINDITHTIYIYKSDLEKERLVKYSVRFSPITTNPYKYLIGSDTFNLFYELNDSYHKINYFAIFNHIYTVYRLNQKEEKNTFKQFVENEKEIVLTIK